MTNAQILTPHNLLDNIKLDNYQEIKYYKNESSLYCEMKSIENNEEIRYLYEFGMDNKLQRAQIFSDVEVMEIFNRSKELKIALENYDIKVTKKSG